MFWWEEKRVRKSVFCKIMVKYENVQLLKESSYVRKRSNRVS